jgi:hypothetical protein
VWFELPDDSSRPFRSLVAPMCLAQALVVSTGHQLAERPAPPARQVRSARQPRKAADDAPAAKARP